ncbi:MAG: carboxymuconolactone decarboxylase family protein [Gammaproteobacteria bacterium]|nr:carboxymuconolactone decarboxylase family protein [Gammaproteobacteria bacterium]
MARIPTLAIEHTDPKTAAALAGVKRKLGRLPNLFTTLAHAPAALQGYLQLFEALAGGQLSAAQRELVAITVAEANACEYCLSAHAAIGRGLGLDDTDIERARTAQAADPMDDAMLAFVAAVVRERGGVSDAELAAARAGGLDEARILEVVALIGLNLLTNYVNRVAETEVDFPRLALRDAA